MPKRNHVSSLKIVYIQYYAKKLSEVKNEEFGKNIFKDEIGNNILPFSLLEEILEELKENGLLNEHNIKYFFNANMKKLDISTTWNYKNFAISYELFLEIVSLCPNLQILKMDGHYISKDCLSLFCGFSHLTCLYFSHVTECKNTLNIIFQNCSCLIELGIFDCEGPILTESLVTHQKPSCQNLTKLYIFDLFLDTRSIIFILEMLPNLEIFENVGLWEKIKIALPKWKIEKLSLKLKCIATTERGIDDLQSDDLNSILPFLNKITLILCKGVCLNALMKFNHLIDIRLRFHQCFSTLEAQVLSYIQAHGVNLSVLKLWGESIEIIVDQLGNNCPNLTTLSLKVKSIKMQHLFGDASNRKPFKLITKLHIGIVIRRFEILEEERISCQVLLFILHNCTDLKTLHFGNIRWLDELFLLELLNKNNLLVLENLQLRLIPKITVKSIINLLKIEDNNLKSLHIDGCRKINQRTRGPIDVFIKCNNLDVQFSIGEYSRYSDDAFV